MAANPKVAELAAKTILDRAKLLADADLMDALSKGLCSESWAKRMARASTKFTRAHLENVVRCDRLRAKIRAETAPN